MALGRMPSLRALEVRAAIVAGGLVGAAVRVGLYERWNPPLDAMPWPTLAVNVVGAFLLGVLLPRLLHDGSAPRWLAPMITVGVLGSLTTFSLVMVEAWERALNGHVALAVAYLAVTLAGGVVGAAAGLRLARGFGRTAP